MASLPPEYQLNPEAFERLFWAKKSGNSLRHKALSSTLYEIGNRHVTWRLFLGIFAENATQSSWEEVTAQNRENYAELKAQYLADSQFDEPLSTEPKVSATQLLAMNRQRDEIQRDVLRTLQKVELFRQESTKEMMLAVLSVWSANHSEIGYRQGMNDLLAILMIVVYGEQAVGSLERFKASGNCLRILNSPDKLEHDCYIMFDKLMVLGMGELFIPTEVTPAERSLTKLLTIENPLRQRYAPEDLKRSKLVQKCNRIFHEHLRDVDNEIYEHLSKESIEPHLFLLRWLRCVFTREFALWNVLILWDAIFATVSAQTGLDFIEYVCTSMIIYIRHDRIPHTVLVRDHSEILQRMMKYPPVEDISTIIQMAVKSMEFLRSGGSSIRPAPPTLKSKKNKGVTSNVADWIKKPKWKSDEPQTFPMKLHSETRWIERPIYNQHLLVECLEKTQNAINLVDNLSQIQTHSPDALRGVIKQLTQMKIWLDNPKTSNQ